KSIVCISIFLQSSNRECNYLQSILGLFYHSASVPEKAIEVLAHAGLSISLTSIHRAVKSLSQDAATKLKASIRTLQTSLAYDNFDMHFKTSQPTIEHGSTFVSATSATAIPLFDVTDPNTLKCSNELWEKDPYNPVHFSEPVQIDINDLLSFHKANSSAKLPSAPGQLNPFLERFAWHVRSILIHHGPPKFKEKYLKNLGEPAAINPIPLHKTKQFPCRAMDTKESTNDGNVEVIECLLRQGGIGEPQDRDFNSTRDVDMSEHILLIHGDLGTKERVDSVRISRAIEETPRRRFQFVVFLPGLFHFKMACADAL
ncbi:hypothetical protein CPC08DRAFT_617048, partial [Agrocybe pediades]